MAWVQARGRELALAVLACAMFLGCLNSVGLWGKREQRAAAESLDTIDHGHWLVAEIQGRPRLEKPPLPRWITAGLMRLTGRSDELIVRLPNALFALGTLALVHALGCRIGGRAVGLASALALLSMALFVAEMRQAGNDGPLTFFTTLALFLAWRRLHGGQTQGPETTPPADALGPRRDAVGVWVALGLAFLCKGPVALLIFALAVVPYLAFEHRLRAGLKALLSPLGIGAFVLLALSWPVPVALLDPHALEVWKLEMGQKAGSAGISYHQSRSVLALEWFWMTAPWVIVAASAILGPLLRRGRATPRALAFPWAWAVLNLAMFCLWTVAKPNYYLPCMPAVALLVGWEWSRLVNRAQAGTRPNLARGLLRIHWVALFVAGALLPVLADHLGTGLLAWSLALGALAIAATVASVWFWRRADPVGALMPLVAVMVASALFGYGVVAPQRDALRSHQALADALEAALPPEARTVMFFHELDEGLWFYLRDRRLAAVPGSAPRYNNGFDMLQDYHQGRRDALVPELRQEALKQTLVNWLDRPADQRGSSYVLIRGKFYDLFKDDLDTRGELVYREHGLDRNELVLLRAPGPSGPIAARPEGPRRD